VIKRPNSKARLKKAQLSFYPEPATYEALKLLSGKTRVPQQAYLREGLDFVLEKYRKELTR
jgi:Ribbon-helix-helix domain